jgi:hypothetical protein
LRRHAGRALVEEPDDQRAALDHIGVPDGLLLDPHVVEVRAVRAAEVLDHVAARLHADLRVPTRDHAIVSADRALEAAADEDSLGRRQLDRALPALTVPKQEARHLGKRIVPTLLHTRQSEDAPLRRKQLNLLRNRIASWLSTPTASRRGRRSAPRSTRVCSAAAVAPELGLVVPF